MNDMEMNATEQQKKVNIKKKGMFPCFKRAWQAVKGTFSRSRKNQGVVFRAQSHMDLSDSQPGPSGQPGLLVFKPTVLQDPATLLPASCNWEKTPLDSAEPQQGPSGLEPSVPEDPAGLQSTAPDEQPADHPPEQRTKGNKTKGILACFKKKWQAIKRTNSQSHNKKVVPLPSQCDLDQSDPQQGPSEPEQTAPKEEPADQQPEKFSDVYHIDKKLGEGWSSTVYAAARKSDGQKVAVKIIRKSYTPYHDDLVSPLLMEVALNLLLHDPEKCPNIVQMLDWYEIDTKHIIVFQGFTEPCLTLFEFIYKTGMSVKLAHDFMLQAMNAGHQCTDHNILDDNLQWVNALIKLQMLKLKFIDLSRGHLFSTNGRIRAVSQMVCDLASFLHMMFLYNLSHQSEESNNLINQCFKLDKPPTLDQILNHEWFKQEEDKK